MQLLSFVFLFAISQAAAISPAAKDSPGFFLMDFDVLQLNTSQELSLTKRDNLYEDQLINQHGYYITYLYLGSNQQKVGVNVDTGSSDLWVVDSSSGCVKNSCQYGTYNPLQSNTAKKTSQPFSITYGDGTSAGGLFYTDTVALGTCSTCPKMLNFQFADATKVGNSFGVLGLGLQATEQPSTKYPNFIYTLKDQGWINKRAYSVYLNQDSADTGTIIFGGKDLAKIDGPLVPLPVISNDRLSVKLDSVTIKGKVIPITSECVIDTGSTLALFTQTDGDSIFKEYKGAYFNSTIGLYLSACDANINKVVSWNFDGITIKFSLAAAFRTLIVDGNGRNYGCGFMIGRFPFNVLGDIFIRNAYTIFDYDQMTISLAQVKYTDQKNVVAI